MNFMVKQLTQLVPAPPIPVGSGSPTQWQEFIRDFGFPFPDDFRSLIDVYGGGGWFEEIGITSPFSPNLSYQEWHESNLEFPGPEFFPVFRKGACEGLLQIGGDCNGGQIFLLLREGNTKTMVYSNREQDELQIHGPGLVSYLCQIATGRKCPPSYELSAAGSWVRVFKAAR